MKLTQELINTLQGIHDGKPWQWSDTAKRWYDADPDSCPLRCISRGLIEIRLKPDLDPYAEAKAAWKDGVLQYKQPYLHDHDCWSDWTHKCAPAWHNAPECYRRKPKTVRVPLGPEDVPPGRSDRHE